MPQILSCDILTVDNLSWLNFYTDIYSWQEPLGMVFGVTRFEPEDIEKRLQVRWKQIPVAWNRQMYSVWEPPKHDMQTWTFVPAALMVDRSRSGVANLTMVIVQEDLKSDRYRLGILDPVDV